MSKTKRNTNPRPETGRTGWRKHTEATATFGLLLVAVALVAPLADIFSPAWQSAMKWIYAAGALVYTVARAADLNNAGESMRVRRLRRMEFWAGMAFCLGAGFWFYNSARLGVAMGMTLGVVRDTVMFTMAGAVIQIIASWMISAQLRKDNPGNKADGGK